MFWIKDVDKNQAYSFSYGSHQSDGYSLKFLNIRIDAILKHSETKDVQKIALLTSANSSL